MPNYVVLRGISTLVQLVVAAIEGLVSKVLHSTRRFYAKHIRGQRGRRDGPLLFRRVVENVVKEPDDTLIPEHIQTVDNAQHFKTMSIRGTSTGREDSYYNLSVKDFIPRQLTTRRKLNKYIIGYEEEITINLR